jgi:hypothetical protein
VQHLAHVCVGHRQEGMCPGQREPLQPSCAQTQQRQGALGRTVLNSADSIRCQRIGPCHALTKTSNKVPQPALRMKLVGLVQLSWPQPSRGNLTWLDLRQCWGPKCGVAIACLHLHTGKQCMQVAHGPRACRLHMGPGPALPGPRTGSVSHPVVTELSPCQACQAEPMRSVEPHNEDLTAGGGTYRR